MVWNDDCYYVLGYSDSHEKVVKFRVDRMVDMRISKATAVRKPTNFDVSDYFSQIFSMYDGNDCCVTLLCENDLMKHIIDRFEEKVFTAPSDDKHFVVETTVSLSQTFYGWVFSFGGKMKITAPQQAIDIFSSISIFVTNTPVIYEQICRYMTIGENRDGKYEELRRDLLVKNSTSHEIPTMKTLE